MADYQDRIDIDKLIDICNTLQYVTRSTDDPKLLATLDELNSIVANMQERYYDKSEVYSKDETYNKDEVYNKSEVYNKDEVYPKEAVYNKSETQYEIYTQSYVHPKIQQCKADKLFVNDTVIPSNFTTYLASKGYDDIDSLGKLLWQIIRTVYP